MAETEQAVKEKAGDKNGQEQNAAGNDSKTQVQSVDFPEAAQTGTAVAGGSINILLDMDVPITVAIGKTEIPIRKLLQLGPGSVLKLDKPVDAPADLYLKDTKFATGAIVVVEDRFAIRVKQILGPGDSSENQQAQQAT